MNNGILRLKHLRDQTEAVGETMAQERERFARLADPAAAPRTVTAFNLFQTPATLADRLAALALAKHDLGARLLEPSAGLGRLYQAAKGAGHAGPVTLAELAPDCCRELYQATKGDALATLKQGDFLEMDAADLGIFDAVLMNPPFKQGRDIKHIRHALTLLAPGGRLVALCYDGVKQRRHLQPIADEWHELPPGTFKESGTNAGAALIVIDK